MSGGDADAEEARHFQQIAATFVEYGEQAKRTVQVRRSRFARLSDGDRGLLSGYSEHLDAIERCIDANSVAMATLVGDGLFGFGVDAVESSEREKQHNVDKLLSTIRQFVRDWSAEGAPERAACYDPLLDALRRLKPISSADNVVRVLVPGAGLARLAFDVARLGFSVTANEFSYHMLIASNWVLNRCTERHAMTLYPFVHTASNHRSRADVLRGVRVPDVCPLDYVDVLSRTGFSMAAGDFVDVFGAADADTPPFDAVVTCFFVDTAHNVVEYMRVIFAALAPGGVWLNLSPLLYHYADAPASEQSIELELDELLRAAERVGFRLLAPVEWRACTYAGDARSMLQSVYECAFFQLAKPVQALGV